MNDPDFDTNPFASPQAVDPLRPQGEWGDTELIRHEHLKHEASIRSIGLLYYLGALLFGLGFVFLVFLVASGELGPQDPSRVFFYGIAIAYSLFAILFVWCGQGLRRLQQAVRWPVLVLSALGLIWFPVGTIINGYALYLLGSKKGNYILSPEYQQIRQATPHIRYKSSFLMLLLAGIVIAVLIVVLLSMFIGFDM